MSILIDRLVEKYRTKAVGYYLVYYNRAADYGRDGKMAPRGWYIIKMGAPTAQGPAEGPYRSKSNAVSSAEARQRLPY